jgi:NADP-dependent 3-hydroxy acid dehydrogenase YdfG
MTKFSVNGFTEALRQEITQTHVRVGVLEPGAVDTELVSHNTDEIKSGVAAFPDDKRALDSNDIAEGITFRVTRPRHASIAELWIMPTDQVRQRTTTFTADRIILTAAVRISTNLKETPT